MILQITESAPGTSGGTADSVSLIVDLFGLIKSLLLCHFLHNIQDIMPSNLFAEMRSNYILEECHPN